VPGTRALDHPSSSASRCADFGVLVITGTGTGVGKTVVTAAVAALAGERGEKVAVVKPAQTGVVADEPGDLAEVQRLAGVADTHELARFPGPLSPEAAARISGLPPLDLAQAASDVRALAASRDRVLVEGAGGLLVRYHPDGQTMADLACLLAAPVLVVVTPGLGTLNHTALTLEALASRGLALAGLVIGSWPGSPALADRSNIGDLESLAGGPLAGVLPAGAGRLGRAAFRRTAAAGLGPSLGGHFDPAGFRKQHALAKEFM
jgi:dethiobiotin synthetase